MQQYELLFTIPGTMTEEEIKPIIEKVKEIVEKNGGNKLVVQDMGKSKLAYPIKHIRYGYFQSFVFEAESKIIPEMHNKIRLLPNLLRAILTKHDPRKKALTKINAISEVVGGESQNETQAVNFSAVETQTLKEVPVPASIIEEVKEEKTEIAPVETKAEKIKMADIDKKLDELLDTDIANV